jgi:hypothetical protein
MKVRIYKAPDGKGKLIKAKNGMAVNVDKEIKKKIAEGKDPEIIIYEMAEFGLSRPEAKSKVNKYYDLLGDDEYDEDEVSAPYDTPVQDEVEKVVEEEEPDNAAIYDYYGGDNQGLDVVNDGVDYDDEEASYGGQYAEGGQFAPGSIIPTPKRPYYIGMDAEPYDNTYKFGGYTFAFGGPGDGDKRRSFYDTAVADYQQWLSNPAAWQEDPEMLAPDGKTLNLCLDCMDMDWNNEQDIRDAHRLIEEGYSTGTHRNQSLFDEGLKKYGLQAPVWGSKKQINQNKYGGLTKNQYVNKRIKELKKAALGDQVENTETNISPRGTIDSPSGFTSPEKNLASIIKQTGNEALMKQQAENEYQQYQQSTMGQDFNGKFLFGGRNRKIKRANRALFGTSTALPGVDVNYEFGPLGGLRKAEANWDLDAIGDLAKLLPGAVNMFPGMMGPGMMSYKKVSYPAQVRKKTISTINNAALDDVANQNPNSDAAQNNKTENKVELSCPPGAVYDANKGYCVDKDGYMVQSSIGFPSAKQLAGDTFEGSNPSFGESSLLYNPWATNSFDMLNVRKSNGKKEMNPTGPSSSVSSSAKYMSTQAPSIGGALLQNEQDVMYSPMNPVLNAQGQPVISDGSNIMWNPMKLKELGGMVSNPELDEYGNLQKFIYGGDEYSHGGHVLPRADFGLTGNFQKQLLNSKPPVDKQGQSNLLFNPWNRSDLTNGIPNRLAIQPSGDVTNKTTQPGTNQNTTTQNKTTTTTNQNQPQIDANTMAQFQQYMQMMQGQQGNPSMSGQQFWTGRPQRLGFGLTRDFNYTNAYSPVNWQVPEGTKNLREVAYKDRGKWWNPFDTKRVREWYADSEATPADNLVNKEGSGTNINTGANWDESELDTRRERRQAKAHDELISSGGKMVDNEDLPTSMETLPPTQMTTSASTQMPDQLQSQEVGNMKTLPPQQMGVPGLQSNTIQTSENPSGTEYNTLYPSGTSSSSGISSVYEPETTTTNSYVMPPSSNQFGTSGFGNPFGNMKNPTGAPTNQFGIIRREYGGYVPDYMAYGGYMPEAKPGIIVDKEEFTDPNLIGRTVEQSAYTFDPAKFAGSSVMTSNAITKALNAYNTEKNILDPARQRIRTSDAATANTGQSGFGSAERAGSDLMARGTYTQYGTTPGQQGYEGGLYGKKGGQMNSQYAKGKVYSLTMEQIKAIEAAGGKVEYIK